MGGVDEGEQKREERSAHELSSCLLELSRLIRGIAFYPAGDPHRRELLGRTFAAFEGELGRCGELQLCADGDRVAVAGLAETLAGAHVEHLARAIAGHGIAGLSLAPGLAREAVEALALLLAGEPSARDAAEAFAPWDGQGIAIISLRQLGAGPGPAATTEAVPGADPTPEPDATEDTLTLDVDAPPAPGRPAAAGAPDGRAAIASLGIPAAEDPRGELLTSALERLAATRGEDYIEACAETLEAADMLLALGLSGEAWRAVLGFAAHASGQVEADEDQRAHAQAALRELCDDVMLSYAIDRACGAAGPREEVRAAQVLLQLGEPAVPAVLERLRRARDPERMAQLSAVVIALGERAVAPLADELRAGGGMPSRSAIQLAGELQSPKLLAPLMEVLHVGDSKRRHDAARSLVTIGRAASRVFIDALASGDEEVARLATHSLGRLGHARAVRPLTTALERAIEDKRDALARDILRALADIGDARAVPALRDLAGRRDWLRRGRYQELKLTAVGALERIAGKAAEDALRALHEAADPRIAVRAGEALARRPAPGGAATA
jgi:HEAT repeat protein